MRSSRKHWPFLVVVVVVVGGLAGGGGWALAASTKTRRVNAQIVANFAQFRRARTAADALPASIPRDLRCSGPFAEGGPKEAPIQGLEAYYQVQCFLTNGPAVSRQLIRGLQRNQSRAVRLPHHLGTLWLIPWGRWLCNLLRSRFLLGSGGAAMACEPISEVLAHPPLWNGGMWSEPGGRYNGNYLFALEPDRITKVTVGYPGGTRPTYLAKNVLAACIGGNSLWLVQTGPTISGAITAPLGGGGTPSRHLRKCRYLS
jgi:hypothetical protein